MQQSFRGLRGMQVHAVPDSEKAFDASGRKLPWGYEMSASSNNLNGREPQEKGPFGRSQRRSRSGLSRSRSKTAEPRREEERLKAEQLAAEEAVFGGLKRVGKEDRGHGGEEGNGSHAGSAAQSAAQTNGAPGEGGATEVSLYGFGEDLQWAAIDFYERVSGGAILEDYDREPQGRRFDLPRSLSRTTSLHSLSKAALRMKNKYAGGDHWIKVTFDSQSAAELACARSPHIIKGHLVYAEPYMGRGPGRDEPIPASNAGAQINDPALPKSFSTNTLNGSPNGSSNTATSATATNAREDTPTQHPQQPSAGTRQEQPVQGRPLFEATRAHVGLDRAQSTPFLPLQDGGRQQALRQQEQTPRQRRPTGKIVEGATAAVVLPASAAMLPKQAKPSWSSRLGAGEVIGSTVPKREDGGLDWSVASFYWKLFFLIDWLFGTDFCGLKGD